MPLMNAQWEHWEGSDLQLVPFDIIRKQRSNCVSRYLDAGRDMVASLQYGTRCPCGYCHISDVEHHKQEDHMESFFLAETVKYLWLLFDLAVGPDNLVENGPYKYIFSTEGHLLPATPQMIVDFMGAGLKLPIHQTTLLLSQVPFLGFCPGLNHGQKFGISYVHSTDEHHEYETIQQKESTTVQSHSVLVLPAQSSEHLLPDSSSDHNDSQTGESDVTS
ncbi:Six-hairpin glycosidase-like superfamily [Sesbania bispinosa]|nr:Six-hairpin glycosidase-like superfamily [Sesbania bispinosa]